VGRPVVSRQLVRSRRRWDENIKMDLCCGSISCCGAVARFAHRATAPQHISTQHDMLPQHLVCKYELNCEYCNITLARNKVP